VGAVDSVGAADGSGHGGGVWAGVAGGCGAVAVAAAAAAVVVVVAAAAVSPLPLVCCWTSPCPLQVPLLSPQIPLLGPCVEQCLSLDLCLCCRTPESVLHLPSTLVADCDWLRGEVAGTGDLEDRSSLRGRKAGQ